MKPGITPAAALGAAMSELLDNRGVTVDSREWAADLSDRLGKAGFRIAQDYHQGRGDGHPGNCYHCGRPENTDPFVISETPLELWSSEGDAGRH